MTLLALCLAPGGAWAKDALEELDALEKKYNALKTIHYVQTVTREGPKEPASKTTVTVWMKRDGNVWKLRRESKADGQQSKSGPIAVGDSGSVTVMDGESTWKEVEIEGRKMVFRTKAELGNEFAAIRDEIKRSKAEVKGSEKVGEEQCVVFAISGASERVKAKSTYWVSEKSGLIVRSINIAHDGTKVEKSLSKIEINGTIPDSKLTYEPAADVMVMDVDQPPQEKGSPKKTP